MVVTLPAPAAPARPASWRPALDRGIGRWRLTALRRLAGDVAGIHDRCQRLTQDRPGIDVLPDRLGRELRQFSLRLSAGLDDGYRSVADRVLTAALGYRPGPILADRLADEVRGHCATRPAEVLLVTPGAAITTARGAHALWSYLADRDDLTAAEPVVRAVDIALDPGCHMLWRDRTSLHPAEVGLWLQRALDSVAARLLNEVVDRCHEVHNGLTAALATVG